MACAVVPFMCSKTKDWGFGTMVQGYAAAVLRMSEM